MFALFSFAFCLLSVPLGVVAGNECQPITWADPPEARAANAATVVAPRDIGARQATTPIQAGDINCRYRGRTYDDANYYTCKEMAYEWGISLTWFFKLNPTLLPDCSNIETNAWYCVRGCKLHLESSYLV
jgi:hypothetical protein